MKKAIVIVLACAVIAPAASASDLSAPTKFLRAYVETLCAEKSGDHQRAVELMTPFVSDGVQMRASARGALIGDYNDASVQATWALVTNSWLEPRWRFAVDKRERKEAVTQLQGCFGSAITDGPKNEQSRVENAAALLAWFLTRQIDPVIQPRWNPRPRY